MPLHIDDDIKCPDDVNIEILSKILNVKHIVEFCIAPLGRGVLSNVLTLDVKLSSTNTMQFLVKFRKDEIPLDDLFKVESTFYELADELEQVDAMFPFRLAKALATGSNCIILELIQDVTCLDVHQSCPVDYFDDLIHKLAEIHAYCWVGSSSAISKKIHTEYAPRLAVSPGAGQSLPASTRQEQFEVAWPAVRKRLLPFFSSEDICRLDEIVNWIASVDRIEVIKRCVEERRYTLVHGDFHMGNLLLPTTANKCDSSVDNRPWLVDWSFSGVGNPIVDLVFFLGMNDVTNIDCVLQNYHNVIKERSQLSLDDLLTMFRECLLNQFVMLVCYDSLCREMAGSRKDQHAHFDRVNTRCARMILAYNFDNSGGILPIQSLTTK